MKTTIYAPPACLSHETGDGHPESPERFQAIHALLSKPPFDTLPRGAAYPANEEHICLAHPYRYYEQIVRSIPKKGLKTIEGDTVLSEDSLDALLHAVGAGCAGVDDIASGKTTRAFCPIRPPGHHAEYERAMGFCFFNNIFIAARYAQEKYGFSRIAIVDFDVHHGNGTDDLTRRHDGSILFISTHQYPLWPMTGVEDDNDDTVLNFTFPAGAGSEAFRALYEAKVFPALNNFAPELLLISAGFDAHRDDPLAQMMLEDDDFGWVTRQLCAIADTHAKGRVLSMLEGGYHLPALIRSVEHHVLALTNNTL